jgi:putative phage-type endonuclease
MEGDTMPVKILTNEEWLEARKTPRSTFGASSVATLLGLNKHCSPYTFYQQCVGALPETDQTIPMEVGLELEPLIARVYARQTGRHVMTYNEYVHSTPESRVVYTHPDYPWLSSTPDRKVIFEDNHDGPLELKTANEFMRKEWDAEPPLPYMVQNQIQMACEERDRGSLAGLIGNRELVYADQILSAKLLRGVIPKLIEFRERVLNNDPPPADGSDSTTETLKILHPDDNGATVVAEAEFLETLYAFEAEKEKLKFHEAEKKALQNMILARIGPATFLECAGVRYSLKTTDRKGFTVEPTSFRMLKKITK